jgi:hypothetical protein
LAVTAGLPANAPAYYQGYATHPHHSLEIAFHRMDGNHDGILTMREFVAAHQMKIGVAQAILRYQELAARGGMTRRNGVAGMTLHQFKAAHAH